MAAYLDRSAIARFLMFSAVCMGCEGARATASDMTSYVVISD
jgi:hypothetical protein